MSDSAASNTYGPNHAALYNLFYADKPYAQEALFVQHCLKRVGLGDGSRLLELACGTANHAFELEKLGYTVVATDLSPHMLASAATRKRERNSGIELRQMDMTQILVPDGSFDAVISLFDSIGYVQTNEAVDRVLAGVARALRPGGVFCFEFWHAAAMLRSFEPVRVRRCSTPQGEIMRISETNIDYSCTTAHVSYTIFEPGPGGTYCRHEEVQTNRFFLVPQMATHLQKADLIPLFWYSGFNATAVIDVNSWHIVAVAQKAGGNSP